MYQLAPWARALYACDAPWWLQHYDEVARIFSGALWTQHCDEISKSQVQPGLRALQSIAKPGLSTDPQVLHQGSNSGYQAINLAYHYGAREVILLGYDMGLADDGKRHFFGDHPKGLQVASDYQMMAAAFNKMHPDRYGLTIKNCSRRSALTCFDREDLNATI